MAEKEGKEMSFFEHLEVLRWVIIRSVLAALLFGTIIFIYMDVVFDKIILAPGHSDFPTNRFFSYLADIFSTPSLKINVTPLKIQNIDMAGQFSTSVMVAMVGGLIVAFPYIFWEIWRFIKPALKEKESKHASGAILAVSSLFFIGILFGYYLISPLSIDFLVTYKVSDQVENIISLDSYISTITSIVLAGGIIFELPVFIYFLSKIGVVSVKFLTNYRRYAIVIIVIVAAVITPPDVVSQSLVAIPLLVLYEVSIVLARNIEKKRGVSKN